MHCVGKEKSVHNAAAISVDVCGQNTGANLTKATVNGIFKSTIQSMELLVIACCWSKYRGKI
jgi:hypothetical protein